MSTHYFGCGYYAPNADVTFTNCLSEGNSLYGFYTTNGGKLYNCVDKDVGAGRPTIPTESRLLLQHPVRSTNPSLVMENCTSIDSHGYGLQVDLASNVRSRTSTWRTRPGSTARVQACGTNGQFGDSSVDITASGDRVDTLVFAKNNQNVQYTGEITSDSARAFLVEGGQNVQTAAHEGCGLRPVTSQHTHDPGKGLVPIFFGFCREISLRERSASV